MPQAASSGGIIYFKTSLSSSLLTLFCVQVPVELPDVGPLVLVLDVLHLGGGGPLRPGVPHPDPGAGLSHRLQLVQAHTQ